VVIIEPSVEAFLATMITVHPLSNCSADGGLYLSPVSVKKREAQKSRLTENKIAKTKKYFFDFTAVLLLIHELRFYFR
jgi:hypothetical protein